jgi:hypothetical protein
MKGSVPETSRRGVPLLALPSLVPSSLPQFRLSAAPSPAETFRLPSATTERAGSTKEAAQHRTPQERAARIPSPSPPCTEAASVWCRCVVCVCVCVRDGGLAAVATADAWGKRKRRKDRTGQQQQQQRLTTARTDQQKGRRHREENNAHTERRREGAHGHVACPSVPCRRLLRTRPPRRLSCPALRALEAAEQRSGERPARRQGDGRERRNGRPTRWH